MPRCLITAVLAVTLGFALARPASARTGEPTIDPTKLKVDVAKRWSRVDQSSMQWYPTRITAREGMIKPLLSTYDWEGYGSALRHPFAERYSTARTWKGNLRWAKVIKTYIRDNRTGKIVAEVHWSEKTGRSLITADGKIVKDRSVTSFIQSQRGYKKAAAEIKRNTAVVDKRDGSMNNNRDLGYVRRGKGGELTYQSVPDYSFGPAGKGGKKVVTTAALPKVEERPGFNHHYKVQRVRGPVQGVVLKKGEVLQISRGSVAYSYGPPMTDGVRIEGAVRGKGKIDSGALLAIPSKSGRSYDVVAATKDGYIPLRIYSEAAWVRAKSRGKAPSLARFDRAKLASIGLQVVTPKRGKQRPYYRRSASFSPDKAAAAGLKVVLARRGRGRYVRQHLRRVSPR
jgi:hypothetical protein